MASLVVVQKRRGRPKGTRGKCSICGSIDHNKRTCSMRKKAKPKKKEESEDSKIPAPVTPPRDNTPHYDEQYSIAPTPSRSPTYRRMSGRLQEQRINASPSRSDDDKLSACFNKKCNIWEDNKKPSGKSYGDCSICQYPMYKNDIFALACGHIFHKKCAPKIKEQYGEKCPKCRRTGAFTTLLRQEPPKDKMRDLKIENNRYLQQIVLLKRRLREKEKEKDYWENEARQLWDEFVTDEIKQYPWFKKRAHNYS